jgi:hypothetical protein
MAVALERYRPHIDSMKVCVLCQVFASLQTFDSRGSVLVDI